MSLGKLRRAFVVHVYADHNGSRAVRHHLTRVLSELGPSSVGLNVGAGQTRLHPRLLNVDIADGGSIDCRASATALPFGTDTFDVVVTQETIEHVDAPFVAVAEIARVLKPGGLLYCQLPFVIGFHPGPSDYWRFTRQGIRELVRTAGLDIALDEITVGGASGYYRISVEFWSGLLSLGVHPVYKILKGLFALLLYPIKWLDPLFALSRERDRIAGGYLIVARKPTGTQAPA